MDNSDQANNPKPSEPEKTDSQKRGSQASIKAGSQKSIQDEKAINNKQGDTEEQVTDKQKGSKNDQEEVKSNTSQKQDDKQKANQGKSAGNQASSSQNLQDQGSKITVREAVHAGTWYTKRPVELNVQLNVWIDMAKCDISNITQLKAIIAPHGGFSFSGPTAAWSYKYVNKYCQNKKLKVFILGPCHYVFIRKCGITLQKIYETPIGNIEIDQETIKQLKQQIEFVDTDKDAEEEENSIEMHLPFLVKTLGVDNFKLIPIMVGSLDSKSEEAYGKVLAHYINQNDTLFVISSDFCHWGPQFSYTTLMKDENLEIYESIEKLDQKAMELIELNDVEGFASYLQEYENTICGKHAISILLYGFLNSQYHSKIDTKFIRYAQSSIVKEKSDSSVSYAAAVSYVEQKN